MKDNENEVKENEEMSRAVSSDGRKAYVTISFLNRERLNTMASILDVSAVELADQALDEYLSRLENEPSIKNAISLLKDLQQKKIEIEKQIETTTKQLHSLKH